MQREEVLDLVSDDDQVIGKLPRSQIYEENRKNFRVINAFIINSIGQIWTPTRHKKKSLFPLALDASVGGHVESGEGYLDAFFRETKEEINVDLTMALDTYEEIGKLCPKLDGTSAFMMVYLIKSNEVPNYNKEDFTSWQWLFPHEIIKMGEDGIAMKTDLPIIVNKLLRKLNEK